MSEIPVTLDAEQKIKNGKAANDAGVRTFVGGSVLTVLRKPQWLEALVVLEQSCLPLNIHSAPSRDSFLHEPGDGTATDSAREVASHVMQIDG